MTLWHSQELDYMGDIIVLCWAIEVITRFDGRTIQTICRRTMIRGVFRIMERSYVVTLYGCGDKFTVINEGDT